MRNTERTDYEIMLLRTRAIERGATSVEIQRAVNHFWACTSEARLLAELEDESAA